MGLVRKIAANVAVKKLLAFLRDAGPALGGALLSAGLLVDGDLADGLQLHELLLSAVGLLLARVGLPEALRLSSDVRGVCKWLAMLLSGALASSGLLGMDQGQIDAAAVEQLAASAVLASSARFMDRSVSGGVSWDKALARRLDSWKSGKDDDEA